MNLVVKHETKIWQPSNLYGCSIGKNCVISAFSEVQPGVVIGDNCKIEMGAFIPSGVVLGDGVFVGPNVVFTNDRYPRAVNPDGSLQSSGDWECLKTVVGDGASIGANATILPGVYIGRQAMVGAGSVVVHDVPEFCLVVGNPAKVIKKVMVKS